MKKVLLFCAMLLLSMGLIAQIDTLNILVIGAHPDDCEADAGGTSILWANMGHRVKFISMTNGDVGHYAEAFEICEYGKQPDDNQIRRLFPMLTK